MNEVCPISHIPIAEIKHPVTFASEKKNSIVYNAEDAIEWLKHYALVVPITNHRICPGFAHEILHPRHSDDKATIDLLLKAGFLDGEGGKVFFSWN